MLQVVLAWIVAWLLVAVLLHLARRAAAARRYWSDRGVPHSPPCPVFGSLRDVVLQRVHLDELLADLYFKFPNEPFVGFWRMQSPALLIRDPSLARTIFISDFSNFSHRGVRVDERADPLTAHLITLSGARWRHLRVRLTAFSSTGRLRAMVPAVVQCAAALEKVLRENNSRPLDAYELTARYTIDVIGACVFGLDFSALASPEGSVLRAYGRRVAGAAGGGAVLNARRAVRLLFPGIARALRLRQFPADVCDFFRTLVSSELDRRERILSDGHGDEGKRADFMQLLLEIRRDLRKCNGEAKNHDDEEEEEEAAQRKKWRREVGGVAFKEAALTEDILAAQAFVFFLAGFDSTSNAASHCLFELARHPRVQKAAREDVLRASKKHPPPSHSGFSYDALQDMAYLDTVIYETLRIHPNTGVLFRECEREYPVPHSDVTLQPGTMVYLNILALQSDEKFFPEPELFRPERFSAEERANIKPYTFLPFGVGPRVCVGERFAYLQMKTVLAQLLLAFDVQPCAETPDKIVFDPSTFSLRSPGPIALRFQPRSPGEME